MDRKLKLQKISRTIIVASQKGVGVDKEKLIAMMSVEFGTSRRTCLEYISSLINSDMIELKEGELWWRDQTQN